MADNSKRPPGGADQLLRDWRGDLRKLRDKAGGDAEGIAGMLMEFPGIGPAGASVFLREVQGTWPSVAPYADDRVQRGAREAGLPAGRGELGALLEGSGRSAQLAAALVRVSLNRR